MNIYRLEIDLEDESGLTFNALVDRPAHNKRLLTFSKQKETELTHMFFNDEKRMVTGVAISANQLIERFSKETGKYFVFFPPKEIEKMVLKLSREKLLSSVNLMHNSRAVVQGITFVEGYFVSDTKRPAIDNENVQNGSYVMTYYIEDEALYKELKNGKFVGYSVEGLFREVQININKNQKTNKMKKSNLFKKVFGVQKFAEVTTTDGTVLTYDGELEVGTAMFIKTDEEQLVASEGSYELEDGTTIVVDANGLVAEIVTASEEEMDTIEDVAEVMATLNTKIESQAKEISALKKDFEKFQKGLAPEKKKFNKTSDQPLWLKATKN